MLKRCLVSSLFFAALAPGVAHAADFTFVGQFGGVIGSGPGQFSNPTHLAVDSAGNVYVADSSNDRIQKFTPDGKFLLQFGTLGVGAGQLTNPNAVAVDSAGNAYVADRSNHRVMQFDSAGGFVRGWGWSVDDAANAFQNCTASSGCEIGTAVNSSTSNGGFFAPHAIAVDAASNVYVSEFAGDQRIQRFDPLSAGFGFEVGWGSPGAGPGQFARPVGLAIDSTPNIFVADRDNSRVQKFSPTGALLATIGSLGSGDGQLNAVNDVAVDPAGNLFVADNNNRRIQKFTAGGAFLASYSGYQPGGGDFVPAAIAFSPQGDLYVIDSQAGESFRILRLREPVEPEPPVVGRTVTVDVVKGEVFIKLPAGSARASGGGGGGKGTGFVPLTEARTVPVRSILDTRRGTVKLSAARNAAGKTQSGQFAAGVFQVLQSRKRSQKGLTELRLKGSAAGFKSCAAGKRSASAALSRRAIRRLRARARGRYRTRGRHSAATVRGTVWTTTDRCDGTLTKVSRGTVAVRDFRLKKTILVKSGKSYLARAQG